MARTAQGKNLMPAANATRPIWAGSISFGLVAIPIKLYPAIREHSLHFNYLHRDDGGRIRYERVCAVDGKHVDWSDIVRGYQYGKDAYVVLDDEDFKKASPEAARTIDIVEFVKEAELEPIYFDVPYYIEPEKRGRHAYLLLREALRQSGKVGIARIVIRTREHLAALKPLGDALVVETMHWADEITGRCSLDLPAATKLPAAEMKMATTLIDAMSKKFEPDELKDHYRDQLMALIEARARGRTAKVAKEKPRAPTNVVDLAKVLKRSLAEVRKARPEAARRSRATRRSKRAA